jgi:hypothetical protein
MKFFLNNEQVEPIDGLQVGLKSDFKIRSSPDELQLTTMNLVLPRRGVKIIREWINQYGLGNGIPASVELKDGTVIRYYVDLWDERTKPKFKVLDLLNYKDITAAVKLKRRDSNFFDRARGFSFEMLNDDGVQFDTIPVEYIIVKDNAIEVGVSLALAGYSAARELINQSIELVNTIRDLVKASTPNVDLPENSEDVATLIIRAVSQVVTIGLLLFALIKLSQQFFELVFPKIRTFQACKVRELMEKSANYFGYQFKSDLLDTLPGLTILPAPLKKDKDSFWDFLQNDLNFSFTKGFPTASDPSCSIVEQLFSSMEIMLNGATKVKNGIVEFESWNYWQNITTNQLELSMNLKDEALNEYEYNTDEGYKRRLVKYQIDSSDLHTLDFFDPTIAERSTENVNVPNADLETITGLVNKEIPFALGVRKNQLNWLEQVAKEFFIVLDGIINIFGGQSSLAAQIDERKGVLQISQQFYTLSKMMYIVNGKQPADYVDRIGANALNDNYHASSDITNQAGIIVKNVPIRVKGNELVNLYNNNFINNGSIEIYDIQFYDEKEVETETTATVKIFENWAAGKQIIKVIGE